MISFFKWAKKQSPPLPRTRPPTVSALISSMTLEEFRDTPGNVSSYRALMNTPLMRQALGVLHHHTPRGFPTRGEPVTEVQAHIELGRKEGYQDALNVLSSLALFDAEAREAVISDFGHPDEANKPTPQ